MNEWTIKEGEELPTEELPEEDAPIEEPPVQEEPVPEEPAIPPAAPANLRAIANDDVIGVTLEWDFEGEAGSASFKVFLNDEFTGAMSSDNKIQLADMVAGQTYKAQVKAVDQNTLLESALSNDVYFEIKGLIGSDNPANWIGVKLDNLTVIYQK